MEGRVTQPLKELTCVERLADVLAHLASLRGNVPGCLRGGPCRGLLFPDTECLVSGNAQAIGRWFSSGLLPHQSKLSYDACDLVLYHLDTAPHNIP